MIKLFDFWFKKVPLVATVGLGLFDILNGYAAGLITILESLIVCLVLYFAFEKILKIKWQNGKYHNYWVIAAVIKIILNIYDTLLIVSLRVYQ